MPTYKVIAQGFYNKTLHKPGHPRHGVLTTDKPLKPVPSWLEPMKEDATAAKKRATSKAKAVKKKAADDAEIEKASFMDNGNIETL